MDLFESGSAKLLNDGLKSVTQELRLEMMNLYAAFDRLAPPEARENDAETDRSASYFLQSYYRMLRTLECLSDLQKLSGGDALSLSNGDVAELCRSVAERAEHPFSLQGVTLAYESDCAGKTIAMNGPMMERVLWHLLSNALKFTPQGGRVVLRLHTGGRFVHISVSDTGRGIPPELLDTVFERFPGERMLPQPHGMGLGLALCRRIVQLHGGRIVAESSVGKGTTFTVSLPEQTVMTGELREPVRSPEGGFNRTLLALSDALSAKAFTCVYLN